MFAYRIYLWVFEVEVICNGNFFFLSAKNKGTKQKINCSYYYFGKKNVKRLNIDKSSKFSVFTINHRI